MTLLLALVLLLPAGAAAKKPVDWTQFRFDAGKTGYNKFEIVINKNNVADLTKSWEYIIPDELPCSWGFGYFFSSPVVDGVIYVDSEYSGEGFLTALNAATGNRLWNFPHGYIGHIHSPPVVANKKIYAISKRGVLYALDAASGDELWAQKISGYVMAGEAISSPTLAEEVVYVGSPDGTLYAFDAENGVLVWEYQIGSYYFISSPAVHKKVVYVWSDLELHALNTDNGNLMWKKEIPGGRFLFPVVAKGKVFLGSDWGPLTALEATTGDELWSYDGTGRASPPAVAEGVVYTALNNGRIAALQANTGQELWSNDSGASVDLLSPSVANGVVYVGSQNGNLYAFDAATGAKLWEHPIDFPWWAPEYTSPVVAEGVVYTPKCAFTLRGGQKKAKSE